MIKKQLTNLLKTTLLKGLSEKEIINLFLKINHTEKSYSKNSIILIQGKIYDRLYITLEGLCYGEMLDYSGKAVKVEDLQPPCLLAPAVMFANDNRLPVSIIAKDEVSCLIIEKNDFLKLCLLNELILKNYLGLISDKFSFISKKLSFLAFKTIREKIANYLFSLPLSPNGEIKLQMSIEELAGFFGVSRPSVSRVFMELAKQKIIVKNKKTIKILDENRLVL